MEPRLKALDFVHLPTGRTRYRIIDAKDPGNTSKHGVFDGKPEADAVCSKLNNEKYQVVPPQEIKLVPGFIVDEKDYVPAFVAIHYHIVDSTTGEYTGDHFEHEDEAAARAAELNR